VARDGLPFVLAGVGAGLALLALWFVLRWEAFRLLGVVGIVFGLFCAYFFRDPARTAPREPGVVVSPGDGRVVEIVTEDDAYVGARATRVSVFLSVFDVHVNRVPLSGRVTGVEYHPGKYLVAFNDKASADNEQTHIGIANGRGTVAFKQIAGLIARRIVCTLRPEQAVEIGQRCGLIRFGSRVDVILPPGAELRVARGQRVVGGETVVGVLP
jgi:phosphatidylserine decarboxylase